MLINYPSINVHILFEVLKKEFPQLDVRLYDERFTSKMASQAISMSVFLTMTFGSLRYPFKDLKLAATAFILVLFPSVDLFTDMAYLITNRFYSQTLFVCCAVFIMLSNAIFLLELYNLNARPRRAMLAW
jgi:hypothetical protein